jgi:hypothetical protein
MLPRGIYRGTIEPFAFFEAQCATLGAGLHMSALPEYGTIWFEKRR